VVVALPMRDALLSAESFPVGLSPFAYLLGSYYALAQQINAMGAVVAGRTLVQSLEIDGVL